MFLGFKNFILFNLVFENFYIFFFPLKMFFSSSALLAKKNIDIFKYIESDISHISRIKQYKLTKQTRHNNRATPSLK